MKLRKIKLPRARTLTATPVFDTYWRFACKRQEAFMRRVAGAPPPWSDDPVISAHRFTNAYRASDRVSQYLIRHVLYNGDPSVDEVFVIHAVAEMADTEFSRLGLRFKDLWGRRLQLIDCQNLFCEVDKVRKGCASGVLWGVWKNTDQAALRGGTAARSSVVPPEVGHRATETVGCGRAAL
jgi:hypothetical protein